MSGDLTDDLLPLSAVLRGAGEILATRVTDLVVDLATDPVLVVDVVRKDGATPAHSERSGGGPYGFVLPQRSAGSPREPTELRLQRDLLDTRVWDGRTRRPARVGEVWLRAADGDVPQVVGLEVGISPVWRRLVSGGDDAQPGEYLLDLARTPLLSRHGQSVQDRLSAPPALRLSDDELAHLVTCLPPTSADHLLDLMPGARAAGVLERLHPGVRDRVVRVREEARTRERRRGRRTAGWRAFPPDSRHRP